MLVAVVGSKTYDLLLLLHILSVIVGFGGASLDAVVVNRAARTGGTAGAALTRASALGGRLGDAAMVLVPIFGIALVLTSGKVQGKLVFGFEKPWISAAFLVWFAMMGVHHGLARPTRRKLHAALEGSPGASDAAALERRYSLAAGIVNGLLVVALYMMIFKPGQ